MQSGYFNGLAHVEWELPMVQTLRKRLVSKWQETEEDARKKVVLFDIQKQMNLFMAIGLMNQFCNMEAITLRMQDMV